MVLKDYFEEKVYLKQQNRFLRFFIFLLIFALVVNSLVTFYAIKNEKTILVPVGLSQTVSFSEKSPDDKYIEEIVKYVSYLAFCYTPLTVDSQFADLLSLFTPDKYSSYKTTFEKIKENVKTAGVSSFFQVTGIKINRGTRKILVTGNLQQWTQDRKFISDETRNYIIDYTFNHGKFMIIDLYECKENCAI